MATHHERGRKPSLAATALAFLAAASTLSTAARGQGLDTLRHHSASIDLTLYRYGSGIGEGEGTGLLLGHNSHFRQQFAERYHAASGDRVIGIIAHLGGTFAHGEHVVEFALYAVAKNGLPGDKIVGKAVAYRDLNLTGEAMRIDFDAPQVVGDSFFVAFNLGDYAHGGYEGDTVGLYACDRGCRSEADLETFGRNAVQWHNHDRVDWHDFYYQNFTPLPIHFAIYPIVERKVASVWHRNTIAARTQNKRTYPPYRWMGVNLFKSRDALGRER
jgi:hypothetical protein